MRTESKTALLALAVAMLLFGAPVFASTITVNFWNDQNMNSPYINEMMKVYVQNKSITGGYDYNYTCYHADYLNGTASITVPVANWYDILITDGNLQWSNTTGCPTKVENYQFWSTVQSDLRMDSDHTYNYWINVTYTGQPRQYFWGTTSWRQLVASLYWLAVLGGIIVLEWYLTKNGGTPSWILPIIIFVVAVILKLALGF